MENCDLKIVFLSNDRREDNMENKEQKREQKKTLEKLVDRMMEEKNYHPHDYAFRIIVSNHSKCAHTVFNFPGEYVKSLGTDAFTDSGRNLMMDCAHLVEPGGFITRKSTINVEHQSKALDDDKIDTIYDYKLYLIHRRNIPSNSIVITNIDPGKRIIYYESHDQIYKVHYLVVTSKEIYESLNILTDRIKNNQTLSDEEALHFAYAAIFVEDDIGKEIIEKLAHLFHKCHIENETLEIDLHHVLKKMIKYHFRDDKSKTRELLTVITEEMDYEKLTRQEKMMLEIEEKNRLLEENAKNMKKWDDKTNELTNQNGKLTKEKNELTNQNNELKKEMRKKDDEIERLKAELDKQSK